MNKILSGGGRIGYLDALKCLGILLVIEGHVRQLGMGIKVYDTLPGLMLYSFNMPLFFFVSGLLAYKSNMGIGDTLKKLRQKFVFLVIPAAVFKLLYDLASHHNPLDVIYAGFGKYWFTITLFECFLLYYLSHFIFNKEKLRHLFLFIVAFIGLGLLSVGPKLGLGIIDMNHLTKYFHFFVLGILAMRYKVQYEKIMKNEFFKAFVLLAFFALLFLLDYSIWPKPIFHFMRDIVLRYLGTFMVVSFFVCHASWFDRKSKINATILSIGRKSLAIYLLQYFFIPHFALNGWINDCDLFTIHVISLVYTIVITIICLMFISILSNSQFVKKFVLGRK